MDVRTAASPQYSTVKEERGNLSVISSPNENFVGGGHDRGNRSSGVTHSSSNQRQQQQQQRQHVVYQQPRVKGRTVVFVHYALPFLDAPSLLVASAVCKTWSAEVNSADLWRRLISRGVSSRMAVEMPSSAELVGGHEQRTAASDDEGELAHHSPSSLSTVVQRKEHASAENTNIVKLKKQAVQAHRRASGCGYQDVLMSESLRIDSVSPSYNYSTTANPANRERVSPSSVQRTTERFRTPRGAPREPVLAEVDSGYKTNASPANVKPTLQVSGLTRVLPGGSSSSPLDLDDVSSPGLNGSAAGHANVSRTSGDFSGGRQTFVPSGAHPHNSTESTPFSPGDRVEDGSAVVQPFLMSSALAFSPHSPAQAHTAPVSPPSSSRVDSSVSSQRRSTLFSNDSFATSSAPLLTPSGTPRAFTRTNLMRASLQGPAFRRSDSQSSGNHDEETHGETTAFVSALPRWHARRIEQAAAAPQVEAIHRLSERATRPPQQTPRAPDDVSIPYPPTQAARVYDASPVRQPTESSLEEPAQSSSAASTTSTATHPDTTSDTIVRGRAAQQEVERLVPLVTHEAAALASQHHRLVLLHNEFPCTSPETNRTPENYARLLIQFERIVVKSLLREMSNSPAKMRPESEYIDNFTQLEIFLLMFFPQDAEFQVQWNMFKAALPLDDLYYDVLDYLLLQHRERKRSILEKVMTKRITDSLDATRKVEISIARPVRILSTAPIYQSSEGPSTNSALQSTTSPGTLSRFPVSLQVSQLSSERDQTLADHQMYLESKVEEIVNGGKSISWTAIMECITRYTS